MSTPDAPDGATSQYVGAEISSMPPMPFAPEPDCITGPMTDKLLGLQLEYEYSGGRRYTLTFDHEHHVTFSTPGQAMPLAATGEPIEAPVLGYLAREIRPDLILVHWLVKQASIHVALCVDLAEMTINSAAMMPPNRWQFFDTGVIRSVTCL